jgi:hypothetical protein
MNGGQSTDRHQFNANLAKFFSISHQAVIGFASSQISGQMYAIHRIPPLELF